MQKENGFYVPKIIEKRCIQCRKCEHVCPTINRNTINLPVTYAAWAEDEVRFKTSSGGAFWVLAKYVLELGGIVFGAGWTEDFYVKHMWVDSIVDLPKLCRSKYAQSDLNDSYKKVKDFLRQNKYVLFVGTPCQVAGLKMYLREESQQKLFTVDFICYYNPSIDIVRRYIDEKYGLQNLKKFSFRDKTNGFPIVQELNLKMALLNMKRKWIHFLKAILMGYMLAKRVLIVLFLVNTIIQI